MPAPRSGREAAGRGALARTGWFVVIWAAGVLAITAVGLAIRFALRM